MNINERGCWDTITMECHHFDVPLSKALADFLERQARSVNDLGCGHGLYVKELLTRGLDVLGFDGNPNTVQLCAGLPCSVLDLSERQEIRQADWTLSLEVGEHIPACYESVFLDNLDRSAKRGVVLSWATEGQGGCGHFNERNNPYVKDRMHHLGFIDLPKEEERLRAQSTASWFKNTLMVFKRV